MTVPSWARVGAKVVCVDTSPGDWNGRGGFVAGEIYTLTWVWTHRNGTPVCAVSAFPRSIARISRFRPLITIEDDIATHFRQHLDVREPVEA